MADQLFGSLCNVRSIWDEFGIKEGSLWIQSGMRYMHLQAAFLLAQRYYPVAFTNPK